MNTNRVYVRKMLESDLDCAVYIESTANKSAWNRQLFLESLSEHDCYIAQSEQEIIGFAVFSHVLDESCLLNIAVDSRHLRKGVATQLLNHCLVLCSTKGSSSCYLEVRVSNHAAIALYKTLGFIQSGLRKNYYPCITGREDALIMTVLL